MLKPDQEPASGGATVRPPTPQPPASATSPLRRRPATLRLRCILRDPLTGSMLATARGHLDDAAIPLRWPRSPAPSGGGGPAGGAPAPAPHPGGSAAGMLLLVEEAVLGRGAFGIVTLAFDPVSDAQFALKRLRRGAVHPRNVMDEQAALRALAAEPEPAQGGEAEAEAQGGEAEAEPAGGSGHGKAAGGGEGGGGARGGGGPLARCASPVCARQAAAAAAARPPVRASACHACASPASAAATTTTAGAALSAARPSWLAKQNLPGWAPPLQATHPPERSAAAAAAAGRQGQAVRGEYGRGRGSSFCVRQLGTFQDEHYLYLLMEYCPGGDLDRLARAHTHKTLVPRSCWLAHVVAGPAVVWRAMPEAAARFYAAGVLLALQALHLRCIVYRDLKPGNVLVDAAGYPRLADFGLAKVLDGPAGRATSACGTLDYMAPEVVRIECSNLARDGRGHGLENWVDSAAIAVGRRAAAEVEAVRAGREAHARQQQLQGPLGRPALAGMMGAGGSGTQGSYGMGVDWWSFGCMLYVLLTGCKPFCPPEAEAAGEDLARVLVRIMNPRFEPPLPPYLSPHARDLLRRLLVRHPRWRLGCGGADAEEVKSHLFFQGIDWEAYRERKLPAPFPIQAVSLPQAQEVESAAHFFGCRRGSLTESRLEGGAAQQGLGQWPHGHGLGVRSGQQQKNLQQQGPERPGQPQPAVIQQREAARQRRLLRAELLRDF